jgi:hypothetical protein
MRLDGKYGATLFTPHPASGTGDLVVDGARRSSVFPSPISQVHEVAKEVR